LISIEYRLVIIEYLREGKRKLTAAAIPADPLLALGFTLGDEAAAAAAVAVLDAAAAAAAAPALPWGVGVSGLFDIGEGREGVTFLAAPFPALAAFPAVPAFPALAAAAPCFWSMLGV
jgi:hypothetical protein